MEPNLIKFDPTIEELNTIAASARQITITDFDDKAQYFAVKDKQVELKHLRGRIETAGKEKREEANAFAKAVIAKEKEYIAIISVEEKRLEALRKEVEEYNTKKQRRESLPDRKAKLAEQDDISDDDFLLSLDDIQFVSYLNTAKERKLAKAQEALLAGQQALEQEKRRIAYEKEQNERIEQAREEERKAAQIREERLKQEAVDRENARVAKEQYDLQVAEAKKKAEESEEKFKAWTDSYHYNPETMMITHTRDEAIIWEQLSIYKK